MYRALGIRLICVVQDRSGFNAFKDVGGYKAFLDNSVTVSFGIMDNEHLQYLERRAGKRAVLIETASTSLGIQAPGRNKGGTEQLTPVLPASQAARIGAGRALLDILGEPLFIITRKPWWEQPDIAPYLRDIRFDG